MSAYADENLGKYHQYSKQLRQDDRESVVFDKIESFFAVIRKLEQDLFEEKKKNNKLSDDHRDLFSEFREIKAQHESMKYALQAQKDHETTLTQQLNQIQSDFKKTSQELSHYKKAWAEVLKREQEAKLVLYEGARLKDRILEVESDNQNTKQLVQREKDRADQAEKAMNSYRQELQTTLLRVHSSEAKFNELSKEYDLIAKNKRNIDDEIQKIETNIKERMQWAFLKEKELVKIEYEKNLLIEKEKIKEQFDKEKKEIETTFQMRLESYEKDLRESNELITAEKYKLHEIQAEMDKLRLAFARDKQISDVEKEESIEKMTIQHTKDLHELKSQLSAQLATQYEEQFLSQLKSQLQIKVNEIEKKFEELEATHPLQTLINCSSQDGLCESLHEQVQKYVLKLQTQRATLQASV